MTELLAQQVINADNNHTTRWTIPLGLAESTIQPLHVNLAKHPNILVFGAGRSGKTNAARAIAQAIVAHNSPEQVRFIMISYDTELWKSVPDNYMLASADPDAKTFIQNSTDLATTFSKLLTAFQSRRVPSGMSPEDAGRRDWWPAPYEIVIIIERDQLLGMIGR